MKKIFPFLVMVLISFTIGSTVSCSPNAIKQNPVDPEVYQYNFSSPIAIPTDKVSINNQDFQYHGIAKSSRAVDWHSTLSMDKGNDAIEIAKNDSLIINFAPLQTELGQTDFSQNWFKYVVMFDTLTGKDSTLKDKAWQLQYQALWTQEDLHPSATISSQSLNEFGHGLKFDAEQNYYYVGGCYYNDAMTNQGYSCQDKLFEFRVLTKTSIVMTVASDVSSFGHTAYYYFSFPKLDQNGNWTEIASGYWSSPWIIPETYFIDPTKIDINNLPPTLSTSFLQNLDVTNPWLKYILGDINDSFVTRFNCSNYTFAAVHQDSQFYVLAHYVDARVLDSDYLLPVRTKPTYIEGWSVPITQAKII